jgi:cell wall-associated NlpC family hydrolase
MPSGAGRRLPSRFALLAGFGFGILALCVAGLVLLLAKPHTPQGDSHGRLGGEATLTKTGNSPSAANTASSRAGAASSRAGAASSRADGGGASAAKRSDASGRSSAGAAGAPVASHGAAHSLVAEVRDPEEARSFPAPASVHHSSAKTPQVAGELKVAAGAASDAEIRSELAKMKQLESAASNPARMQTVPGGDSIVGDDGAIPIPRDVPEVVQRVIAGANAIANFPYVYGGGHASFVDDAYDCSGSVSYALAAGGLLSAPETSGQLESWGAPGPGKWITVYANAGHTYMYVNVGGAWMLYDTAGRSGVFASRWQPSPVDNAGYVARHWPDL